MIRNVYAVCSIRFSEDRDRAGKASRRGSRRRDELPDSQGRCGEAIGLQRDCRARHRRCGGRCDECRDRSKRWLTISWLRSRKFDNRHDWKEVDAAPVESWIQREATVLLGERIKAKSWVVGVKVFADHIWQKVLSKEYQSFSIGGRGVRVPRVRFG